MKWLPSALAGAQAATSIGGTTTHSLHEAHQGGGTHPQLEQGLAETRLTRGGEERNPLTRAFGHFHISRHCLNQTVHTSFSFLGCEKSWSLFLDKREERLHCYECFRDTLHTPLYAAVLPRRLASYKLYQWAPLPSSCQLAWPIGGQVRDTKGLKGERSSYVLLQSSLCQVASLCQGWLSPFSSGQAPIQQFSPQSSSPPSSIKFSETGNQRGMSGHMIRARPI